MMISPGAFYEERLEGKTTAEIMAVIRSLKQEIGRIKNIVENPNYDDMKHFSPSERTQIFCLQLYLERAKMALIEAGGTYTMSKAELKAQEFDDNIPYINKIVFSIGGFFNGHETKTFTVDGDKVKRYVDRSLITKPLDFEDGQIEPIDKEEFLEQFYDLHIGEWRRKYDTSRYNIEVLDGTQWELQIHFSNGHKPVEIYGDNAYPYNFDRLLEVLEIENEAWCD